MSLPEEILAEASVLFEDVRPESIDPEAHAAFVIARVLDRGTMRSVAALMRYYGRARIRAFFREGGATQVSPRTLPAVGCAPEPVRGRMHTEILTADQVAVLGELKAGHDRRVRLGRGEVVLRERSGPAAGEGDGGSVTGVSTCAALLHR